MQIYYQNFNNKGREKTFFPVLINKQFMNKLYYKRQKKCEK